MTKKNPTFIKYEKFRFFKLSIGNFFFINQSNKKIKIPLKKRTKNAVFNVPNDSVKLLEKAITVLHIRTEKNPNRVAIERLFISLL
jgi:hypothetical protein